MYTLLLKNKVSAAYDLEGWEPGVGRSFKRREYMYVSC